MKNHAARCASIVDGRASKNPFGVLDAAVETPAPITSRPKTNR
jgi:hypothetical protein